MICVMILWIAFLGWSLERALFVIIHRLDARACSSMVLSCIPMLCRSSYGMKVCKNEEVLITLNQTN